MDERQASLRKAVCSSFVRALRRLGMSGRAEIQTFGPPGGSPSLFVTVERVAVRVSQEAMSMLSQKIVEHAKAKYDTEIICVYWRIEIRQDQPGGTEDLGPSTAGYLVEESAILDSDLAAIGLMLRESEGMLDASERILSQPMPDPPIGEVVQQLRDKTTQRRQERELVSGDFFQDS
ncbi:MAG: hypothetical protein Q8O33_02235 [Pseudomonadota bacterium]|nr:hypothetical protein [Pseudomonadota bacterium]